MKQPKFDNQIIKKYGEDWGGDKQHNLSEKVWIAHNTGMNKCSGSNLK